MYRENNLPLHCDGARIFNSCVSQAKNRHKLSQSIYFFIIKKKNKKYAYQNTMYDTEKSQFCNRIIIYIFQCILNHLVFLFLRIKPSSLFMGLSLPPVCVHIRRRKKFAFPNLYNSELYQITRFYP